MNASKFLLTIDMRFLKSFLFLMIITIIDFLSIGTSLFKIENKPDIDTRYFSSVIYIITAFVAQVVYPTFSSITTGITASIVFEASCITQKITTNVYKYLSETNSVVNIADIYLNTYVCIAIGTFLYAMCSFLCYHYKLGNLFKNIPLLSIFTVMSTLGIELINQIFEMPIITNWNLLYNWIYKLTVAGIGLLIFFIEGYFQNFNFLIPFVIGLFILGFNIVFRVFFKYTTKELAELGWIASKTIDSNKNIWDVITLFKGASLNWKSIVGNLGNIFQMIFLNLIYININLLPYAYAVGKSIDFNKEWCCQSIGNFIATFTGFPTYFVSSSSIMFYKSGGYSKYTSLFGAFAPLLLAFIFPYLVDYTPNAISFIMLVYLGIYFLNAYLISYIKFISVQDLSILVFGIISSLFIGSQAGFAIVIAISTIIILHHYVFNNIKISYNNQASETHFVEQPNDIGSDNIDVTNITKQIDYKTSYNNQASETHFVEQPNDIGSDNIDVTNITKQIDCKSPDHIIEDSFIEQNKDQVIDNIHDNESLEHVKNSLIDFIQEATSIEHSTTENKSHLELKSIEIDYMLHFLTLERFKKDLSFLNDNFLINFSKCPYIDINANLFLIESVKHYKNITFFGIPNNLYYNAFKNMENVTLVSSNMKHY